MVRYTVGYGRSVAPKSVGREWPPYDGWVAKASSDFEYDYDERIGRDVPVRVERFPDWRLSVDVDLAGRLLGIRIDAPDGLSHRALNDLPLDHVRRAARNAVANVLDDLANGVGGLQASPDLQEELTTLSSGFADRKHPGNRGRGDLFYAEVARDYLELCEVSTRPIIELAKRRDVPRGTASEWRRLAQTKGMLTRPPRGRAGGELTPLARTLLAAGSQTGSQSSRDNRGRR